MDRPSKTVREARQVAAFALRTPWKAAAMNKPNTISGDLANLPAALAPLCKLDHWVLWKWQLRKQKWTKPPFTAAERSYPAKNNDPATWAPYLKALEALKRANGAMDGIGFTIRRRRPRSLLRSRNRQ